MGVPKVFWICPCLLITRELTMRISAVLFISLFVTMALGQKKLKYNLQECGSIKHGGGLCVHPVGGRANAPQGTRIIFRTGCSGSALRFCYTRSFSGAMEGDIIHQSGHCLVPASLTDSPTNNMDVVLGPCGVSYSRWRFLAGGNVQHVSSGMCWHPLGGSAANNRKVCVHQGCTSERRLTFRITPQ